MDSVASRSRRRKRTQDFVRVVTAREFCREWFGATSEEEQLWGYHTRCVELLSEKLKVKPDTVERWGKGADFDKMPTEYETYLGYVLALKEVYDTLADRCPQLLQAILEQRNLKPR